MARPWYFREFWRDGMVRELQKIADGDKSERTFDELQRKFDDSKTDVTRLMQQFRSVRDKLSGKVADQVDKIMYDAQWEDALRSAIEHLIEHRRSTDTAFEAR